MILVTGASGGLGRLVVAGLRAHHHVPVIAGSRTPATEADRVVDFDRPDTLVPAFAGVGALVLISAGYAEDDVVLARHGAAIDAAVAAGVRHVIYTSLAGSGDLLSLALVHRWTERRLFDAEVAVTVLRNGLYPQVLAGLALVGAADTAKSGVLAAPLGGGRVSLVCREDLADVAVRVALEAHQDLDAPYNRHAGRSYELEGVTGWGGGELAAAAAEVMGRPVSYVPVPLGSARDVLARSGLLPYQIGHTLSLFANAGAGLLEARASDLPLLLATDPRPVGPAIAETLAAGGLTTASVSVAGRGERGNHHETTAR